jgi:hypothetical protein
MESGGAAVRRRLRCQRTLQSVALCNSKYHTRYLRQYLKVPRRHQAETWSGAETSARSCLGSTAPKAPLYATQWGCERRWHQERQR